MGVIHDRKYKLPPDWSLMLNKRLGEKKRFGNIRAVYEEQVDVYESYNKVPWIIHKHYLHQKPFRDVVKHPIPSRFDKESLINTIEDINESINIIIHACLLYTSDAADDTPCVDLGGRRIIKKKNKKNKKISMQNIDKHRRLSLTQQIQKKGISQA
eukprot:TRINITY_DN37802_c0_g1_i1.p1 TRINITY_DN37802_c0_g1~~TRINITY_DN37802_c0_g1_i1.p1  ORF type:complete len:156 (-),score=19.25 TRINITY_DN37802_c0_g1_i1:10-477(-)